MMERSRVGNTALQDIQSVQARLLDIHGRLLVRHGQRVGRVSCFSPTGGDAFRRKEDDLRNRYHMLLHRSAVAHSAADLPPRQDCAADAVVPASPLQQLPNYSFSWNSSACARQFSGVQTAKSVHTSPVSSQSGSFMQPVLFASQCTLVSKKQEEPRVRSPPAQRSPAPASVHRSPRVPVPQLPLRSASPNGTIRSARSVSPLTPRRVAPQRGHSRASSSAMGTPRMSPHKARSQAQLREVSSTPPPMLVGEGPPREELEAELARLREEVERRAAIQRGLAEAALAAALRPLEDAEGVGRGEVEGLEAGERGAIREGLEAVPAEPAVAVAARQAGQETDWALEAKRLLATGEWTAKRDKSGQEFYVNNRTQTTTWDLERTLRNSAKQKPIVPTAAGAGLAEDAGEAGAGTKVVTDEEVEEEFARVLAAGIWVQKSSVNGRAYYFNKKDPRCAKKKTEWYLKPLLRTLLES